LFQSTERTATPAVKRNWRFQQALYRAYYDAYLRARLKHEMAADAEARAKLRWVVQVGPEIRGAVQPLKAVEEAEAILSRAAKEPVAPHLRMRVSELAEALFQSIHAQLSVPKYQAIAIERGANLDGIDAPLT